MFLCLGWPEILGQLYQCCY